MSKNYTNALIQQRRTQATVTELLKDKAVQREINRQMHDALEIAQRKFFDKELVCIVYSLLNLGLSIKTVRRWIKNYRKMMTEFGSNFCTDMESDEFPEDIKSFLKLHGINYNELIGEEKQDDYKV